MKSDRRSFLKFAAAAPAAAPVLLKSTAEALGANMGNVGASLGAAQCMNSTAALNQKVSTSKDWMREEAKQLLQMRKNAIDGNDVQEGRDARASVCANVDSLRSVSPSSRIRMAEDRIRKAAREAHINYLDQRLKKIKDDLGLDIFGTLFDEIGGA